MLGHNFTVLLRDYEWQPFVLNDVDERNIQFSTTENGYDTMLLPFKRPPDDYLELNFNMVVLLKTPDGDSVFEGFLDTKNTNYEAATGKLAWTCYGFWFATTDTLFAQTPTTGKPEDYIKQKIMNRSASGLPPMTYLPRLLFDFSQIYTTGLTAVTYSTPDSGLTKIVAQQAILQACASGDSLNQKVIPFVWENRILGTKPIAPNPTAKYVVESMRHVRLSEKQSMSDSFNRVQVKYINSGTGTITYVSPTSNNYPLLPYWAMDYPDDILINLTTITSTNYIKDVEVDITKLGSMTSTSASYYGLAALNSAVVIRPIGSITLLPDCRIWDAGESCYRSPYELRAGEFIQFPKTQVRPSPGWGVFNGNDKRLLYISRTEYRGGDVVITPARPTDITRLVK